MAATASKPRGRKPSSAARPAGGGVTDVDALREQLARHEDLFAEITSFVDAIARQDEELRDATTAMLVAKEAYDDARAALKAATEARDGAKHALFAFLRPGPAKLLPLFDRMEKADPELHGRGAALWREEPISALRLSLVATTALTGADVLFVGQLQDRVLEDGDAWWQRVEGLTAPVAAAVVDRLNEFVADQTGGGR